MAYNTGQYGGTRAPSINPQAGGAAVFGNLDAGMAGMTPYGAIAGVATGLGKAALTEEDRAQTANIEVTQSTGSKVFNTGPGRSGMDANPFWSGRMSSKSGSPWLLLALAGAVLVGVLFVIRKR